MIEWIIIIILLFQQFCITFMNAKLLDMGRKVRELEILIEIMARTNERNRDDQIGKKTAAEEEGEAENCHIQHDL